MSLVPYEVLIGIDPLVGLGDIAQRAGKSRSAVTGWRRRDPRFPTAIAELQDGPVFALSAVIDYLVVCDGHPPPGTAQRLRHLDAQARAAGDHTDWTNPTPAEVEILMHSRQGLHLSPAWQWRSESAGPIAGGGWWLANFTEDDTSETGETMEPVCQVTLPQLMDRRDWEVWLCLHTEHLNGVIGPALALLGQDAPVREDGRQLRVAAAALALSTGLDELADAVVAKGEHLRQQQHQKLMASIGAIFALGLVARRAAEAEAKELLTTVRRSAED
jgi:hypothetical protein